MIKINLLPPEYRVKERTPLPMMMGILGGVAVCALAVFGFLYMRLVMLHETNLELQSETKKRDDLAIQAKVFDELEREQKALDALTTTVKKLEQSRYMWGRAIDELSMVIDDAGKQKVHSWITSLDFDMPLQQQAAARTGVSIAPGGTIKFDLEIKGTEFSNISEWRKLLKAGKGRWLPENIKDLNPPKGSIKEYTEYIPPLVLQSRTEVELMPPTPPPAPQPAPQQGKKG